MSLPDTPALRHLGELGVSFEVRVHGPVSSLEEAAAARGVDPEAMVKTIVVRRGEDDYVLVLVPGSRVIAWPRLRAVLEVNRLSMPDADEAKAATGYERGTITPFGLSRPWPVIADSRIEGATVSVGGGTHGVGVLIAGDELVAATSATVADVTDPR